MAMSKGTNTYNRQSWEDADFPILCQTCLGDNPYIRMIKEKYGKECKICSRPFTIFRWCPGVKMRFKKTEVCQTCAKLKNVCQTCILDLEYGLPIKVRDKALGMKNEVPMSDVNKEYYIANAERQLKEQGEASGALEGKAQAPSDLLLKLARTAPYYKRNRPHICSFWVKGECKRGEECPYRHEKPTDPDDPLADQNIKDRYYGEIDPVADKLLKRAAEMPRLEKPEDRTITTIYVGNLNESVTENELRDHFYQYGEIRNIHISDRQQCAFVTFANRAAAENAVEKTFDKLIINGRRLTIRWGKSQGKLEDREIQGGDEPKTEPVPGIPGELPLPPVELQQNFFNLAPPTFGALPNSAPLMAPPGEDFGPRPRIPFIGGPLPMRPPPILGMGVPPFGPRPLGFPPVAPMYPPPRIGVGIYYPSMDPSRLGASKQE